MILMRGTNPVLSKAPLYEQAYEALKADILSGALRPGERLTDQGLAERLGISRTPVREAVRQLVKEGLLVGTPNRGVTVFSPSPVEIAEVYAIRASLEGLAATLTALNPRRMETIQQMGEVLTRAREAAAAADTRGIARCNTEFHELILKASESPSLISLLEPIRNKAILCRLSSMQYQTNMEVSLREHAAIISCLEAGQGAEAGKLLRYHITAAGRRLLEQVGTAETVVTEPILRFYQLKTENGGAPS